MACFFMGIFGRFIDKSLCDAGAVAVLYYFCAVKRNNFFNFLTS